MPDTTTTETTQEEKVTRASAITAAVESATKDEGTTDTTVKKDEENVKTTEETKTETSDEPTEEEKVEALKFYAALKNPETRDHVIDFIATKAGYKKSGAIETKQDVKEAKEDLISLLKEGLGDEFAFLADKIAPGIDKYLGKVVQQSQQDLRASQEVAEREKLENQSAKAIQTLTEGFFGADEKLPDNVQAEMSKFMDKVPPSEDASPKEYLELAFNYAIGKLGLQKVDKSKQKRIENNRNDAASRLASDRSASRSAETVQDTSKPKSRRESIQAAVDAVMKEMK